MVYLDHGGHLTADSVEELHAFAKRIGMRREWYQDHEYLWHYDLMSAGMQAKAITAGARRIHVRDTVRLARERRTGGRHIWGEP